MKQVLFFCLSILVYSQVRAQSNKHINLYAYTQSVSSGVRHNRPTLDDKEVVRVPRKPAFNRWIYITVPAGSKIKVDFLYIKGKKYSVDMQPIEKSPVLHINTNIPYKHDTTVLVPKTTGTIYLLKPTKEIPLKVAEKEKNIIEANEVIVVYTQGCKTYSTAQKAMTRLERALLQ